MKTSKLIYALCLVAALLCTACSRNSGERIGLKLTKKGGVYEIPCSVNGINMKFIFDTGASDVCISLSEALFLIKNGYIKEKDIKGASYAQLADGNIVENTNIVLREINIAGCILKNVEAKVVHSLDAPLLFGQSAIKKLGRIELFGDSLYITPRHSVKHNAEQHTEGIDSVPIYLNQALRCIDKELYALAETHIDKALTLNGDAWQLNYVKGYTLDKMGKAKQGTEYFDKAYNNNTTQQDFIHTLDTSCDTLSYNKFLEDYYKCLFNVHPSYQIDSYTKEYEQAVLITQHLYERDDSYINMYRMFAACTRAYWTNNTHSDEAKMWSDKLLTIKQDDADVYKGISNYYYAKAYRKEDERLYEYAIEPYKKSLEYIEKAYALDSTYIDSYTTTKKRVERALSRLQ